MTKYDLGKPVDIRDSVTDFRRGLMNATNACFEPGLWDGLWADLRLSLRISLWVNLRTTLRDGLQDSLVEELNDKIQSR
jgi:hypothetical protein